MAWSHPNPPLSEAGRDSLLADGSVPLQLRTLRIGMRTTLLAPLVAAAALVLSRRADVEMGPFGLVFVCVAISAGLATLLPYERFFRKGWGMPALYMWSVVNLALIAIGIWATGGSSSPLTFLYALTTLLFAVAFPPGAQAVFLILTVASYSMALGVTWDPLHLAVLAVLAFLANLLVGQLKRQMAAHQEARLESERRWALLAVVSAAGRRMSAFEPLAVLRAVVDSVVALGFPGSRIYVQEGGRHRVILPLDVPEDFPQDIDSLPSEAVERVFSDGLTVVVGAGKDGRHESLRRIGLWSVVLIPIAAADRVEAVLVVGVEEPPGPSPQDVEVFQMLAAQAAVALENARRFEEQRRSLDRIAELDRMKSDFLSSISHELRTPLTVIAGMGRTLEQSWSSLADEDRRDLLARLNANAAALGSMIAELLDFGRLEAGRLGVDPTEVDLRELLNGVVDRLASLFRHHSVQIEVEDGLNAHADPLLVERVVENLLTNAAKYTPAGSRVQVSAIADGQEAVVAVTDDGPGMPAEELCHIGERFFRGGDANTRSTRGTGLGLALVSEVLDLHGTYLEVQSELGIGSRFSFRLQRTRGTEVGEQEPHGSLIAVTGPDQAPQPLTVHFGGLPGERFETVLAAAQASLEWAVAALFHEFHPRVLRYLRARVPGRAEELASATWNDIASALPTFEGDERSFRRWVFAMGRRRLEETRDGDGSPQDERTSWEGDDTSTEGRAVDAALALIQTASPEQVDVLLLRAPGDLDVVDITALTGVPPDLVRVKEMERLKHLQHRAEITEDLDLSQARSGMER